MPQKEITNSTAEVYVRYEDVLALISEDSICELKPSVLRKKLAELPAIIITELEDDTK